jgi:tRNA G18 (ribose-2'-O)-methylase SpoU
MDPNDKGMMHDLSSSSASVTPADFRHASESISDEDGDDETPEVLEWDRFEFSDNPKWDERFNSRSDDPREEDDVLSRQPPLQKILAANAELLDDLVGKEAEEDQKAAARLERQALAWETLDLDLVRKATVALVALVRPERLAKIKSVLRRRTRNVRFLFENPANPSNVWACLRTIDSFGIQHVDVVLQSHLYRGKAALSQKRGMRTALGSARWLTVRNHLTTTDAVRFVKQQGFCVYASDVNPSSRDIRSINWKALDDDRPVCIVMGNEERGISDEMRTLADETFYLPMAGFAESFNLSAATAITLAYLNAATSTGNNGEAAAEGPIRPGDLNEREYECLVLKGMLNSVANKRVIQAYLKREGIVLPDEIRLL